MEGVEWTKVKYNHSGHTLNINLNINKNQDCKTGTVWGGISGRVEGEGRLR
jgi:hypothetical protein